MNARVDRLFAEARQLTIAEQEELLARLDTALDDDGRDSDDARDEDGPLDPELRAEVERRIAEVERGEVEWVSADDVFARLRGRLGER